MLVLLAAGIGITPLLAMAHARAASGASFTLHYYVSRAQEAAFATEIARQLTGWNLPDPLLRRGAESAPAAGAGSGGSGRRHPGLLLRSARIYGPGSRYRAVGRMGGGAIAQRSVPAARPDGSVGGGRNLHHHPRLHRGTLAGPGEQNHRPGAAGAWRRGAASPARWDLRRLPDAGAGEPSTTGIPCSRRRKTGRRAAYCAVLLPQPVGQFSYRSRGISGPSPAGQRWRPVSPARRRKTITIALNSSRPLPVKTPLAPCKSNTAPAAGGPGADGQLNRGDQQTARAFCFIRHGGGKPRWTSHRHQTGRQPHRATSSPSSTVKWPNVTISSARTLIINGTSARVGAGYGSADSLATEVPIKLAIPEAEQYQRDAFDTRPAPRSQGTAAGR